MPKLTKKLIDSSVGKGKDYVVWDDEIKGFGCRIYASGYKTYIFQYRAPATQKNSYLKIGVHGNYTVELARDKAKKLCADIAHGIDPKEKKKAEVVKKQQSLSFEEFWQIFTEKYIKGIHKPSTINRNSSRIKNYILPFFGKKSMSDINRQDILNFQDSLSHIKGTCSKCLILLTTAFNQAELWEYIQPNTNPCKGVSKHPDKKMERYLSVEELIRLEQTLSERTTMGIASPYTLAAFRLIIYSGCRLGEVLSLKWEDVDFNDSCLRLKDSKTGKRTIPLNDSAIEVLHNVQKQEDNPYVFCGNKKGTHLVTVQKTWDRIRKKAGISDVRIHDLRHSFASFMIKNGVSLFEVSKLLGHSNIATTMRYAHLSDRELVNVARKGGSIFKDSPPA